MNNVAKFSFEFQVSSFKIKGQSQLPVASLTVISFQFQVSKSKGKVSCQWPVSSFQFQHRMHKKTQDPSRPKKALWMTSARGNPLISDTYPLPHPSMESSLYARMKWFIRGSKGLRGFIR